MRWLGHHPDAEIAVAQSSSGKGLPVGQVFPSLVRGQELCFSEPDTANLKGCDVVFLAVDNGHAACLAKEILDLGSKVIDLSADHRFRDTSEYEQWYAVPHPLPVQSAAAVYGLPELHKKEISIAVLVGNPGCYATATILALAPLLAEGLIEPETIVVDGKSGVSGAGRSNFGLGTHFAEVNEAVSPYKVGGSHRHTGEIEQELNGVCAMHGLKPMPPISFTPHLVPMSRGILVSCYAKLAKPLDAAQILEALAKFYDSEPFVNVVEALPSTKHTLGSARCHLHAVVDKRTGRVSVFSVLDNLGKGMATQAIQNMNLMFGLEETAGLTGGALWP